METLGEQVGAHLRGERSLADLSADLAHFRGELERHQSDVFAMLTNVPDFMVDSERSSWLAVYSKLEELFSKAEQDVRDQDALKELQSNFTSLSEELVLNSLALRDAAWAARGPSSHPGVNELLYLLEQFLDEPSEERQEILSAKVEVEFQRLDHQSQVYQNLPEFAAAAMEELLPEYQGLLESVAQIADLPEEEHEGLVAAFEEWAAAFAQFDVDFLQRRYSKVPTQIPVVNFVLNCQMLYLEEMVNEDMVDYAIALAVETLERGSEQFLKEKSLSVLDRHTYDEVVAHLLEDIRSLAEASDHETLREIGGELITTVSTFAEIQSRAEDQGGSRLDFKSEIE